MSKSETITFAPEEIHELFKLSECIVGAQDNALIAFAISDVLSEAVRRMNEMGTSPADDQVIPTVVDVIRNYGHIANEELKEIHKQLYSLYKAKTQSKGGASDE